MLLDVDGTLVDSNDLHAGAWQAALAEHGYDVDFSRVRRLIGMGGDKLVPELTRLPGDSKDAEAIRNAAKEQFMSRFLPQVRPFRGTRELLERLRQDGFRLAVASSAGKEQLEALLERAGIQDLIEVSTNADDAEHSKPDPDIVQATLRKLGVRAAQAIMLGDTPYDVAAALRSGLPIVGLRSGGWSAEELRGAVEVYAGSADLLQHYQDSLFARAAPRRGAAQQYLPR